MLLANCLVFRRYWRLYAFFPDFRTAQTQSGSGLRPKRPVSQRSVTSNQQNWPLAAEHCAADTLRAKPGLPRQGQDEAQGV